VTVSSPTNARATDPPTASTDRFRPDIQGLRAIAVLSVLLYHASVPFIDGGFAGVDVFFVISGFLITSHLVSELERTGRVGLGRFYARRIRRILPASFVVLAVSIAGVLLVVPRALQPEFLRDAVGTSLYVPNILFAVKGTDYLAETAPSPFQHYWSLGVEEQFYLIWPVLLFASWVVLRRRRGGVALVLGAAVITSLAAAIALTFVSQPWAFFSLPTRAWELGTGAVVAVAQPLLTRIPRRLGAALSWFGLLALVASLFVIDPQMPFPGVVAIWPVLATALVIAGGSPRPPRGAELVLRVAPAQFVGRISYSLYLVHWPLIVLPAAMTGQGELGGQWALVALAATFPLAWALYRLVEVPFQRADWSRRRRSRTVFALTAAVSLVLAGFSFGAARVIAAAPIDSGQPAPVVTDAALPPVFQDFVPNNLTPSIAGAAQDLPATYADGCHLNGSDQVVPPTHCSFGDTSSTRVVALFGDSHAAQWFPALDLLGKQEGFRLDVYTKSSCPSVDVPMVTDGVLNTGCAHWRSLVLARLVAEPPSRVVLSNFAHYDEYGTTGLSVGAWNDGLAATLAALPSSTKVTLITDTPSFPTTPAVCLSAHLNDALACSRARPDAVNAEWATAEAASARAAKAQVVDLNDFLCDSASCGVIIGNRLLYRDPHHLTASYAELLASPLGRALDW
jgi:peptidoglycan/LPS O-acetylase OafA/YrhL